MKWDVRNVKFEWEERFVGWKGYFADYLPSLKRAVEEEDKEKYGAVINPDSDSAAKYLSYPFWKEKFQGAYCYFYPVEAPKQKEKTVYDIKKEARRFCRRNKVYEQYSSGVAELIEKLYVVVYKRVQHEFDSREH